jgi:sterol desaturase/sphingolipid hydroxylase (fatty acid hydroxylase superfamily)
MQSAIQILLAWKSVAIVAWLGCLFLAERLWPASPRPPAVPRWRRVLRNAGLFLVNIGLSPLVVVPLSAWAASHGIAWRPAWWTGWAAVLVDVVVLDALIYWWHRANHELPLLWRFHEVHHLDRFLDTTTAVRFHFGEVLLSALARGVVILLLGFPLASVLVFETVVLLASIFHHSNARLPPEVERILSRVVVTPSIHWVHHHRVRRDTDSNYGTLFSFWDRVFSSRSPTPRRPDMPIGVERRDELPLLRLLARPFYHPEVAVPARTAGAAE